MIVRTLQAIVGGARDVHGPTWRSLRLLLADDGMGFSLHVTTIHAGTTTTMHYRHHLEAVYCVSGRGSVRTLPDGPVSAIAPGTVYALDAHDHHELRADETLELVCVFSPALHGRETHDEHGAYPPAEASDASRLPGRSAPSTGEHVASREPDPYPTRGATTAMVRRREPVLHGGADARGPLTREELLRYSQRGFLVRRRAFGDAEVEALRRAVDDFAEDADPDEPRLVREPDSMALRSIFAFHTVSGPLARLCTDERLVRVATQILGSDVAIHQSRVNLKPAFDGREFAWHSDFETWHAEDGMPSMRALSAFVMLTPNDARNGAMLVVPGSHRTFVSCVGDTPPDHHRSSLRRQERGVPDRETLEALARDLGVASLVGSPGDLVFFDCNLLHASPGNLSPLARANAFVVFDSVGNRPRVPMRSPRPPHVADDGSSGPVAARPAHELVGVGGS